MVLILVPTLEGSSEDQMIESHGLTQSTQLVLVVTFFVVAIIFFYLFYSSASSNYRLLYRIVLSI